MLRPRDAIGTQVHANRIDGGVLTLTLDEWQPEEPAAYVHVAGYNASAAGDDRMFWVSLDGVVYVDGDVVATIPEPTPRCQIGRCHNDAVVQGGRTGPFDWEGYVCADHVHLMDWTMPLPPTV